MNREAWLTEAVKIFRETVFAEAGLDCPECRVSCGFPSTGALSPKKRRIGECWDGLMAKDNVPQLFISPFLVDVSSEQGVLATLGHEMVHAAIGCKAGHGPKFKKAMLKIGLAGKPTSTVAGEILLPRLAVMAQTLGVYPHSELVLVRERKVQTTRMHKCECPECGYTVRVAKKWIALGVPACPVHPKQKLEQDEPTEN